MVKILSKEELIDKYESFFNDLKGDNHFYRLGKPFKTTNENYFYDLGTGKVFCVNENVYKVLYSLFDTDEFNSVFNLGLDNTELESSLAEIKESIEKENILSAPPITCFTGPQSLSLEEDLKNNMSQLILETTQRCNLRCKYCVYQEDHNDFRSFSQYDMTFETAKKAIDFTYARVNDKFSIAFYGGEPLLRLDLVKPCIDYAENLVKDKTLTFAMTTNAVLMTKELAEYFAEHEVFITVSLDGPEEVHDRNRQFPDGTGSFKFAIRGLKYLVDAYKEKSRTHIFISMVTSESDYIDTYNKMQSLFDNTDWLPNLTVNSAYVSYGRFPEVYRIPNNEHDRQYRSQSDIDPLFDWMKENQNGKFNKKALFSNRKMKECLHKIHRRDLTNKPMTEYYFNGCCVPGSRRLYVNAKGDFLPCERVGTVPSLGNVDSGFDIEKIKKYYVNDYMNESVKYCNNCWAAHLCTRCYTGCFDNDKVNLSYRHSACDYTRYELENDLILYHEILEDDPESLRSLNDIVLK